jgi:hypothetical protein
MMDNGARIEAECFDIDYRGGGVELTKIDELKPAFCGFNEDCQNEEREKGSPSKTKQIHKLKGSPSKK